MNYHYLNDKNTSQGPLSIRELKKLYLSSELFRHSLVAKEGGEWATLESLQLFDLDSKPANFRQLIWNTVKYPIVLLLCGIAIYSVLYFGLGINPLSQSKGKDSGSETKHNQASNEKLNPIKNTPETHEDFKADNINGRTSTDRLYPIKVKSKWGYANRNGEIIVKPIWDKTWPSLDEEKGIVVLNDKRGVIDRSGKLICEPVWDSIHGFIRGMAYVTLGDKCGFINSQGEIIIKPNHPKGNLPQFYSEGLVWQKDGDTFFYIDEQGKQVLRVSGFQTVDNFFEGLAKVKNPKSQKYGFINTEGETIIRTEWDTAGRFGKNGLARVEREGKYGFINKKGELAIPLVWDGPSYTSFKDGLARVQKGSTYSFIDETGKVVIQPQFDQVFDFSEGLARVWQGNKGGFINKQGRLVIPLAWGWTQDFKGSLARVKKGRGLDLDSLENISYIDKQGSIVFVSKWDTEGDFKNGIARVGNLDLSKSSEYVPAYKYGYIDRSGRLLFWEEDKAREFKKPILTDHSKGKEYDDSNLTKEDVAYMKTGAKAGVPENQYVLGVSYFEGKVVPENKVEAAVWFHKAAEQGHARAQYNLALLYGRGEGVIKNEREGIKWLKKAAKQGHLKALRLLKKLPAQEVARSEPAPVLPTKPVLPEFPTNELPAASAKKELPQIKLGTKVGEQLKVKISPDFEITFRWCPPGQFTMGSTYGEKGRASDEIAHEVKFSKGFWIAETECSQILWAKIMKSNPSIPKDRDLPVNNVSHRDIIQFLAKINREDSKLPKFDLPTESQWEYACRAGAETPFNINQAITSLNSRLANFDGRHPYGVKFKGAFLKRPLKAREYPPNSWGIYDMHGNMLEWCKDYYSRYPKQNINVDPYQDFDSGYIVLRGGSYGDHGYKCRAAQRFKREPTSKSKYRGFRLLINPE